MDIQYSANEKFDCFTMDQFPRDDTWYLASPSEIEECVEIERATGGEIVGDHLHVGVGVVSGKDKAFLMTNEEFEELSENCLLYTSPSPRDRG